MADDFDDLFARTSPSRNTAFPSFSTSPSATSPTSTSRTGPSGTGAASSFGAFGEDDFGVSSNPFADMQSSTIYHAHQQDEAAISSPPRSIQQTESQQEQPKERENSEVAAKNDSQEDQPIASAIQQEADSPFIEDPGAGTTASTPGNALQASSVDLYGSTGMDDMHGGFGDPFPTSPAKPALRVDDLEDDHGFRDPPDTADSEAFSSRRTSVSVSDSQPGSRNGYEGNDAASVRTVGLDSDVASLRSTNTLIHPEHVPALAPLSHDASGRPSFIVTVADPTKVGSAIDPINSHTVYTIRTRTSSTNFRKNDFSVLRRYRDFLWLNERLQENNPGVIVPPPPEKAAIGRFSQNFVETRRLALQHCLQAILKHPLLYTDPDLRTFLESDTFHIDVKQRAVQASLNSPADPKPGFFSSLTSPRFAEFDDFFETRRGTFDALEASLKTLITVLHNLGKQRLAHIQASTALHSAYVALASCEVSAEVKEAVTLLAVCEERRKAILEIQMREEEHLLLATAESWARLISSVRAAFASRIKAYQTHQRYETSLRNARSTLEKAKRSSKSQPELITSLIYEANEVERKVISSKRDFEEISKLLKTELVRFDEEKIESFKSAIETYSRGLVERQRTIVNGWKEYLSQLDRITGQNQPQQPNQGANGQAADTAQAA